MGPAERAFWNDLHKSNARVQDQPGYGPYETGRLIRDGDPAAQSDRPSPRGGGPAHVTSITPGCDCQEDTLAVRRAKELIASAVESCRSDSEMAAWIGRASWVLEELTRDA